MKNEPFYLYIGYQLISFGFEYYIFENTILVIG